MAFKEVEIYGRKFYYRDLKTVSIDDPIPYKLHKSNTYQEKVFWITGELVNKLQDTYNELVVENKCKVEKLGVMILPKCVVTCDDKKVTIDDLLAKANHSAKFKVAFRLTKNNDVLRLTVKVCAIHSYSPVKLTNLPQHFLNMIVDDSKVCAICTDKIEENPHMTSCCHLFHKKCVEPWLQKNHTCPVCRAKQ